VPYLTTKSISSISSARQTFLATGLVSLQKGKKSKRSMPSFSTLAGVCLWALASTRVVVQGFVATTTPSSTPFQNPAATTTAARRSIVLSGATGWGNFDVEDDANRRALTQVTPELARKYRRTVYTHDDWKKHRQEDRFVIYLQSMLKSGVYENAKNEIAVCTFIAALVGGYTGLGGMAHPAPFPGQVLGLPMTAFTLTGSSLGLLLSTFIAKVPCESCFISVRHLESSLNPYSLSPPSSF
jgi:hypothetical protein